VDDDDEEEEYVRKVLNQLHVKSIACFFFFFSPLSICLQLNPILEKDEGDDGWMDGLLPQTTLWVLIEICRMCNLTPTDFQRRA
jgi:hypothetical protein